MFTKNRSKCEQKFAKQKIVCHNYGMYREWLINKLVESVGSKKTNIIQFSKGYDIDRFLFVELKNSLFKAFPNYHIVEVKPGEDILSFISSLKEISSKNPVIVLINDVFSYKNPEAIINSFYGFENISAFITSDVDISYQLGKKDTLVRGRYNRFFLPPSLFGDSSKIENINYCDLLSFGSYSKQASKIYSYILNHSGKLLSYRKIHEGIGKVLSIGKIIDIVDYMINHFLFYRLFRVDVSKNKDISSGFICYPTHINNLDEVPYSKKKKYFLKTATAVVARMVYNGFGVKKAISYYYEIRDGKRVRTEFDRGFLVFNFDKKVIINIHLDEDDNDIEKLIKFKSNIPHLIGLPGNSEYIMDCNGLTYVGIEKILGNGLGEYGGIQKKKGN